MLRSGSDSGASVAAGSPSVIGRKLRTHLSSLIGSILSSSNFGHFFDIKCEKLSKREY